MASVSTTTSSIGVRADTGTDTDTNTNTGNTAAPALARTYTNPARNECASNMGATSTGNVPTTFSYLRIRSTLDYVCKLCTIRKMCEGF